MGHCQIFLHISLKKGHKGWLLRKKPGVIIKLNYLLKVYSRFFGKFKFLNDFLRNLALQQCDPYIATPVRIRINPYSVTVSNPKKKWKRLCGQGRGGEGNPIYGSWL
jgi:hypothetical protein